MRAVQDAGVKPVQRAAAPPKRLHQSSAFGDGQDRGRPRWFNDLLRAGKSERCGRGLGAEHRRRCVGHTKCEKNNDKSTGDPVAREILQLTTPGRESEREQGRARVYPWSRADARDLWVEGRSRRFSDLGMIQT